MSFDLMRVRIAKKLEVRSEDQPSKVTLDRRDVEYLLRIADVAAAQATCAVNHMDKPEGWTCLNQMAEAATMTSRYMPEYRAEILAGNHLCDGCRLLAALGE